ncbi:MAG TPA: ABC transporter ATP-binding protein [Anaerolineales bacterium]|nr:ABC transporter ATP-binding protein [Anaerolineales bacterium]
MNQPDQMHALAVNGISKHFGGVHAVRTTDFVVPVGERRALIGPNGAGKTTLFNLITGELKPDTGDIKIFGTDITKKSVQERSRLGLGRTYQISQLFLELTVEENLFLAGKVSKKFRFQFVKPWRNYVDERSWANHVAAQVGLEDHMQEIVSEISHGMQRQLELGMAIAMRPRIIMLDEPAAGLSPSERVILTGLIRNLPEGVTLILIEHDMEVVLGIADRITVLNRGSIIAEGTPQEIRQNQEVQKVYLGGYHD